MRPKNSMWMSTDAGAGASACSTNMARWRDFEFQFRRRDGEIRTAHESAFVTRDDSGAIVAYQGFLLDITERKQAEIDIRRRNRELLALNAIGSCCSQSSTLEEGLTAALCRKSRNFSRRDCGAVYLLDEPADALKLSAAVGCQSGMRADAASIRGCRRLLEQMRQAHATLLSGSAPALPEGFRELQRKEGSQASQVVVLWAKDRIMGTLLVGCREPREFSTAELNLLAAVGNQIATTIDKSLLLEETREAYEACGARKSSSCRAKKWPRWGN